MQNQISNQPQRFTDKTQHLGCGNREVDT